MDLQIKKVWLPGAASCLLFFGFYFVLIWLPFDKNRFQYMAIPYLVLPFVGALAAYWSRRMKGSVLEPFRRPPPQRTVALTTGLHQRDATDNAATRAPFTSARGQS